MRHLELSFKGRNNLWRYIIMIVLIFTVTNTVGSLPLTIVSLIKSSDNPEVLSKISSDLNSLTTMGIDQNLLLALILFSFIAGLAAYGLMVRPMHGRSFLETVTGAPGIRWSRALISGLIWMLLMAVYLFVYIGFDPENFSINNNSSSLILLGLIAVILIPFQAAFEEVLFRGYLMQGFTLLIPGRLFPLAATSVMFALMHSLNPEVKEFGFFAIMPQYLTFGLVFGIITILDDGIEAAIGAHAANNVFLCIMVTQKSSALQTQALYQQHNFHPLIELAGLVVSGIVLIMILKKIFKWDGFFLLRSKVEPPHIQSHIP
ncbi:MAG TPA: CPBP family intramembrane glutamic endopeptidase [Bacteroidales bacterium]|nr:CPBP family intramembrane glutamic endopeptidase [Bacteroidales bacterium]